MAYSLRFTGIGTDGKELFCIEPSWWTLSELGKHVKLNWITTNETGSYTDKDADISAQEARILHERFRPKLLKLIAYNKSCIKSYKTYAGDHTAVVADYIEYVAALMGSIHTLDAAVGSDVDKFSHFHLCIFEWDSGY